jgi:hypothetical protein
MKHISISLLMLAAVACGGPLKYQPKSSAKAPGVIINVVADVKGSEAVTKLTIKAEHLPPPGAIKEGNKFYVVWQRHDSGAPWARISGLTYDEGAREGKLMEATVPATQFELEVTAEEKNDVMSPSADVVFDQIVNK